jgi:hypothetical protein
VTTVVGVDSGGGGGGCDLPAGAPCRSYAPGCRFVCIQTKPVRNTPKKVRNSCTLYAPRTTVARAPTTPRTNDARKAFDDLFKI